jgi:hypothetical protein
VAPARHGRSPCLLAELKGAEALHRLALGVQTGRRYRSVERIEAWPSSSFTTSSPAPRARSSVAVAWRNMCGVTARDSPARRELAAGHLRKAWVVIGCPKGACA